MWCKVCATILFAFLVDAAHSVAAQDFSPGETVEYKVRGAFPAQWERGTVVRSLDGGKQYLIREKPNQFYPQGFEAAYNPGEVRPLRTAASTNTPSPAAPQPVAPPPAILGLIENGAGLLSPDDIFQYSRALFGNGDPFAHPQRQAILDQIRDSIKARGTSFLPDLAFSNRMGAIGAYSVHISSAIEANYGAAPKLDDYIGTFLLRVSNRGSQSTSTNGSTVVITTTDEQLESGELTIKRDGSYIWKQGRNDPADTWLHGKWRAARPDEMHLWEGGPAIWLEQAKQGQDYMVRACRIPGYASWIDVGMGKGRTPVEYGRRK
jgi:hypothetical protein